MLKQLWNAARHLLGGHIAANLQPDESSDPRATQAILSVLPDIGYIPPGTLGQPTTMLYQELTRRDTLIWRAA